jgi:tetratricopeptide (TPR) repeat protein
MPCRNALAIVFLAMLPLAAADQWIKLTTPHFELYTTAGEKKGREAILYFEQVRNFFLQASPSKKVPEFPVRIVAFRSEKQYKPYRVNESAAAYYTQTQTRDYIVMQDIAQEHYPVAIHEYTHLIVEHTGLKLPVWLNEGWAELYSTLKPLGNKAMVGDLIPGRVQTLLTDKWLDLATLTSAGHDSPYYNEKNKAGIFYAQSWALMHMLYLSPVYRPYFTRIVVALANGKSFDAAVQSTLGRSIADVQKDLQGYLHSNRLLGAVFDVHLEKSEEEAEASSPSPFDLDMTLADLLAANRKTEQARQEYERIAKENPGKPEVEESLGYLAWQGHDQDAARAHFAKAFAAGSNNPRMCFDYAMLGRSGHSPNESIVDALDRAVKLKPDYTEARLQLGLMKLNTREWSAALGILGQVHNIDADQAPWLFNGLALAYAQLGDRDAARANVEKAKKYAKTPEQSNRSDELLRFIDAKERYEAAAKARAEQPRPDSIPQPVTGKSEASGPGAAQLTNPFVRPGEELKRVEGVATHLDCTTAQARLRVSVGAKTLLFAIDDPKRVLLKHSGQMTFDFTCGPQKPFGVAVEYVPESNPRSAVAGVLRAMEF